MKKEFNYKLIFRLQGSLLLVESFFLLATFFVSLLYRETDAVYFLTTAILALLLGVSGVFAGKNAPLAIGKREGSVIVTSTWILFTLVGMLPFWLSGNIASFSDAFFETMSGFTTTGASVVTDVEALPRGMLFWRSLTHWMGGLGIIVISMALLPIFGFSSVQIYSAEVTGPSKEKLHPKFSGTAKRLFGIYILFTAAETLLLCVSGMDRFDALCHSFSTVATGGFSTKNASIGHWDSPCIEFVVIAFMILASINFKLYYFLFVGKIRKVFSNEELRYYLIILLTFTLIITATLIDFSNPALESAGEAFRNSLFTVSSLISTTGFYSVDYSSWAAVATILLLILMLIGGSAGSTAGGIKIIRVLLVFKYCYYEFKRMIHPNAIFPVKYDGKIVREEIITRVLAYVLLYCFLAMAGSLILSLSGLGFQESVSSMISCLGNVGPGLGKLGPIETYSSIPTFGKWFLSLVMLIGRLDLFTALIIFTPVFWRK
ncbi:MAG: TrkH family potassium uptake protein [Prevotellaceae bacterium]|jgi:trk system potassium uptake protein TrkH|nr:TrkH family potassium uptake protein [Prevotellaceae bacterium]